jgi:hypothetical protein
MELLFNKKEYKKSLRNGLCAPPDLINTFFPVDRVKFHTLKSAASGLELGQVKKRLSPDMFTELRGALGLTMKHAQTRFPAYPFLIPEYINEEWLASVDWHKKFHRDHVLHQPMCVYVGFSLLRNLKNSDKLGETLLDKAVNVFLEGRKCKYLHAYLAEMASASPAIEKFMQHPELVRDFFLEIFFLTALFHDIGYPWQFTSKINCNLTPLGTVTSVPSVAFVK